MAYILEENIRHKLNQLIGWWCFYSDYCSCTAVRCQTHQVSGVFEIKNMISLTAQAAERTVVLHAVISRPKKDQLICHLSSWLILKWIAPCVCLLIIFIFRQFASAILPYVQTCCCFCSTFYRESSVNVASSCMKSWPRVLIYFAESEPVLSSY